MPNIKFLYMMNEYTIKVEKENLFSYEIFKSYAKLIGSDLDELYFSYHGKRMIINENNNLKIESKIDKNEIKILVINLRNIKSLIKPKQKAPNIICPSCKQLALIKINEDRISIDCSLNKKHSNYYSDLTIDQFTKLQNYDDSQVKCDCCQNLKYFYKIFYICSCEKKICPICLLTHDSKHSVINYDNKFNQCIKHSIEFCSFCKECNINLCPICENEHKHKIIFHKSVRPSEKKINEIKTFMADVENKVKKFKLEILKLEGIYSKFFVNINDNLDEFMIINSNMTKSLDKLNNYESMKNVVNYKNKKLIKDFLTVINEANTKNKLKFLLDLYDTPRNEMNIIYDIKDINDTRIRLFGENFVKLNKDNCFLLINEKKYELCEFYDCKNINNSETLEVDLIEVNKITKMSFMFCECNNLIFFDLNKFDTSEIYYINNMFSNCTLLKNIPNNLSKFNTINVRDMSYLFSKCELLNNLPDISKWNISNCNNISHLFHKCLNLIELPDLSKWNTHKVADMSLLFNECTSLKKMPDISKWDTKNVIDMNGMFSKCLKLENLPDYLNWNTSKVKYMCGMFQSCTSFESLPNISKWDVSSLINMSGLFNRCTNLKYIPNISKWNTSNVINMSAIFQECIELKSIPDLSLWKTSKVIDMSYIFNECKSLESILGISEWDTSKVINMKGAFSNCKNLKCLPDISKWIINNVQNIGFLFNGCSSLIEIPDISKWETSNVTCMCSMFQNCYSISSIPIISDWNIEKVTDLSFLFNNCRKLEKIPDLSKWNTENVIKMNNLFTGCYSLKEKPDISSWKIQKEANTKNIINDNLSNCLTKKTDNDIITKNISDDTNENLNINMTLKLDSIQTIKPSNLENETVDLCSDCGRKDSYLDHDTPNSKLDSGRNSSFLCNEETKTESKSKSKSDNNQNISDLNKKLSKGKKKFKFFKSDL